MVIRRFYIRRVLRNGAYLRVSRTGSELMLQAQRFLWLPKSLAAKNASYLRNGDKPFIRNNASQNPIQIRFTLQHIVRIFRQLRLNPMKMTRINRAKSI